MRDYWRESLEVALDDVGATGVLTPEQINQIAGALEVSAENRSLCSAPVENPATYELRETRRRHEQELALFAREEKAQRDESDYRHRCHVRELERELERARMEFRP